MLETPYRGPDPAFPMVLSAGWSWLTPLWVGALESVLAGDEPAVLAVATVWSPVPRTLTASFIPPRKKGMSPSHRLVFCFYLKPHKKNKISEFPCTI